jgi:hypothetical protein
MYAINSKIDAIKLIRAFAGMGLKDSKIVAEAWEAALANDFHTSALSEIILLGHMVTMVENGEWTIDEHDKIIVRKVINTSDILALRR